MRNAALSAISRSNIDAKTKYKIHFFRQIGSIPKIDPICLLIGFHLPKIICSMSTLNLQNQLKSTGTAYLFLFFLLGHYAYLGKWGLQVLFWLSLGGLGIWLFIDLFRLSAKVQEYNRPILDAIEIEDRRAKEEDHRRHLETIAAINRKA